MYRVFFLLLIALLFSIKSSAQLDQRPNLQLGYFGDMGFHPGLKMGYEFPIKVWTKLKTKKKGEVKRFKSWNAGMDFLYYWHFKQYHGLALCPSFGYTRTKENGNFLNIKMNIGWHRSIIDGTTYEVQSDGNIKTKKFAGQSTLYGGIFLACGKDLRIKREIPIRYYFQIGTTERFPHNRVSLSSINLGVGLHYFLNK